MAASTSRPSAAASRIATAAANVSSENQSLIAEIRKALGIIKSVAVDLEREEKSENVKQLEDAVLKLLDTYDGCVRFSEAVQIVSGDYQPSDQPTDFKKLLENEVAKLKSASLSMPKTNPLYRQFKEAIWNVHHAGQPMPGEEQEEVVMTSTQCNLLNITCPLTGKPVIELTNPVRCVDCKHIYEKDPIMHYIRTMKPQPRCPVAGCPKILQVGRVVCDALLPIEIEEMRSTETAAVHSTIVEDFTEVDDE
ncbi:E3 SUMO-protein ligase MMS21 isoform X1 [Ananas comosus]|uniref:E3 SUMO-protein ligase MMS21 isoform X1 n=1 Tax=Ananas comosus TaxID=4615 RepID=A0A6P5G9G8_ANACO|nr:E3 SUMO-protein ligase MMS21 isoform X1 [Ananas comosus]XP_020105272.1 E3 SUMO-protein ligase MMS21 isoform X1 [Ananas comosus]